MKAKKQVKKIFGNGGKVSKEKKVKPYQAKGPKDYEYRKNMYNDSLNLYNYTKLQKEIEPEKEYGRPEAFAKAVSSLPSGGERKKDEKVNKAQHKLYATAKKIVDDSKYIKMGKPLGNRGNKTEDFWEKTYYKAGSTDLKHPTIMPKGEWWGMAENYDYSNVKPKQKILPPIEKKEKPKTVTPKKTVEVKKTTTTKKTIKAKTEPKKEEVKAEPVVKPEIKQTFRDTVAPNRIYNQSYGSHGLIDEKGKVTWDRPATAKEKAEAKKTPKMANGGKVTKKKKK